MDRGEKIGGGGKEGRRRGTGDKKRRWKGWGEERRLEDFEERMKEGGEEEHSVIMQCTPCF